MKNLTILQDFVPYRGRCPASPHEKEKVELGKLMPLGYLFKMCPPISYEGLSICWSCEFSFHKSLVKMAENAKIWIVNCPLITREQITCKQNIFK